MRHAAAWGTLAAVLVDAGLATMPERCATVMGALSRRLRGWPGAILVGLLHPLILGMVAVAVMLAAARIGAVIDRWYVSGPLVGLAIAFGLFIVGDGPRRVGRHLPAVLVGVVLLLAGHLVAPAGPVIIAP